MGMVSIVTIVQHAKNYLMFAIMTFRLKDVTQT